MAATEASTVPSIASNAIIMLLIAFAAPIPPRRRSFEVLRLLTVVLNPWRVVVIVYS